MTAPWWGREANAQAAARMVRDAQGQLQPELAEARRQTVEGEVRDRIVAYTPEWTRRQESDPGLMIVDAALEIRRGAGGGTHGGEPLAQLVQILTLLQKR